MDLARSRTLPLVIPVLTVVPTAAQLFMFSAVTWNRHRIHYSKEAAVAEGHTDVVVQRALLGNFLARMLEQWLADRGEIRELSWKVLSSATPGTALHCTGEATTENNMMQRCEVRIIDDQGTLIAVGQALCVLTEPTR